MDEHWKGRMEEKVDGLVEAVTEIKNDVKALPQAFAAKWVESVLKAVGVAVLMGMTGGFFYWFFMNVHFK